MKRFAAFFATCSKIVHHIALPIRAPEFFLTSQQELPFPN
jgi:hypothetical protein